jgi:protein-S-isoprenylcysteine O-methyltransferase Ste14
VTEGVFRISRHPQIIGWLLQLKGLAIAAHSAQALAFANALWLILPRIIQLEERHLDDRFGDQYAEYVAGTPRWLGMPR